MIPQGEDGEQGDPLVPLLFCLSLHKALVAANARLREGESLFAFLDDVYVTCAPERVLAVRRILRQEIHPLWKNTDLEPRRGEHPVGVDPDAVVWRGDAQLAPQQQEISCWDRQLGMRRSSRHNCPLNGKTSLVGQDPTRADSMVVVAFLWSHARQLLDSDGEPQIQEGSHRSVTKQ